MALDPRNRRLEQVRHQQREDGYDERRSGGERQSHDGCEQTDRREDVSRAIVEAQHVSRPSTQEHLGGILGSYERLGGPGVGRKRREDRRVLPKMLLQGRNSMRIIGMVREKLGYLGGVRGVEVLKQPHEAPWVVAARRAHV